MQPVRLVYILSSGHSGSTLLDLLLNAHSGFVSVGELKRFIPRILPAADARCTCGELAANGCDFWRGVQDRLAAADVRVDAMETDTSDPSFLEPNVEVLRAISQQVGGRVVVDSSKSGHRLGMLLETPDLQILPVVLVRDARGQVFSAMRRRNLPLATAIQRYNRTLRRIERLVRDRPFALVRYEELVLQPERALQPILGHYGLTFEPGQLGWATFEKHSLAGNHLRHSRNSELRLDTAWKRELSPLRQRLIRVGTWPARRIINRLASASARQSDLATQPSARMAQTSARA